MRNVKPKTPATKVSVYFWGLEAVVIHILKLLAKDKRSETHKNYMTKTAQTPSSSSACCFKSADTSETENI